MELFGKIFAINRMNMKEIKLRGGDSPARPLDTLIRGGSRIPCRRGCRPSRGGPTYDFVKFCKKLHEIEKILGRGARGRARAPLNPPLLMQELKYFTLLAEVIWPLKIFRHYEISLILR